MFASRACALPASLLTHSQDCMTTALTLSAHFAVHVGVCVLRGSPHMCLPGLRLGLYFVLDVVTASHKKKEKKRKKKELEVTCISFVLETVR